VARLACDDGTDVVVLVLGLGSAVEAEGVDRTFLGLPSKQQQLLDAVVGAAARCRPRPKPVVLVLVSAGGVALPTPSASRPWPDAIVWVGYGGEEQGNGVLDVLLAREGFSPTGRLPVTWYANGYLDEVGPILDYGLASGVGRTYRFLDESRAPPLFRFGFGLSFSRFAYADLSVETLDDPAVVVSVTVRNVGDAPAAAVAQLYLSVPRAGAALVDARPGHSKFAGRVPYRSLAGFQKTKALRPGESVALRFRLEEGQQLTTGADGARVREPGTYTVSVGGHQPAWSDGRGRGLPPRPEEARESNVVQGTFTVG
jgi:beta-glucosidase